MPTLAKPEAIRAMRRAPNGPEDYAAHSADKASACCKTFCTAASCKSGGYALALYTGQRRADLVKLKWSSIAGNAFRLQQQKTKTNVVIPIHPALKDALSLSVNRLVAGSIPARGAKFLAIQSPSNSETPQSP